MGRDDGAGAPLRMSADRVGKWCIGVGLVGFVVAVYVAEEGFLSSGFAQGTSYTPISFAVIESSEGVRFDHPDTPLDEAGGGVVTFVHARCQIDAEAMPIDGYPLVARRTWAISVVRRDGDGRPRLVSTSESRTWRKAVAEELRRRSGTRTAGAALHGDSRAFRFVWRSVLVTGAVYGLALLAMGGAVLRYVADVRGRIARARVRRGMCHRCGYPLGEVGANVCPECGAVREEGEENW